MKKRMLCALLCVVSAVSIAGCSGGDSPAVTEPPPVSTAETEVSDTRIYPDLPEKNFAGAEFRLMQWYRGENHMHNYFEFYSEGENGEILNDTVYKRNRTI